ncbi:PfaD family polyunsaturated fatty acid/polyketide biosynthesis protein [Bacillus atrophaeus]|uniref:PfaD family polyunsaturated fatty acid/polyketide biosynthesis protein n=1 Tax=Bacillus atrophaeus TaxID=1452 RepID=UPI001F0A9B83|nr:PfaD family polyunsaturated fatty acid/polyketide biosynthesis protein [Bacillus atrophaeus]WNV78055.1 PfaD family polyunsaturated fatty acid/polyketide biosynthesis protein [Bacillus atrophaeus]
MIKIKAENLGDSEFRSDYGVRYSYVTGAMTHAISSPDLVCKMGEGGFLSFLGTGGINLKRLEELIQKIQSTSINKPWGVNLICDLDMPTFEESTVELFLRYGIRNLEASAFMQITKGLVIYRISSLTRNNDGSPKIHNRIMAKISRPEVARKFLLPPPERIVNQLFEEGRITAEEAEIAKLIPMADDVCVEADSGGHTDQGVAYSLVPAIMKMRDDISKQMGYSKRIRVGTAGGLGTPEAIASAFILGADFVLTGSINQATVEAGTSNKVKEMLQAAGPQDTAIAPAGDMFELGAKVQVLNKGLFFPARANKLYDLYRNYPALEDIDERTKIQIQDKFFHRSFQEVYGLVKDYYLIKDPIELEKMEKNSKHKMAKIFRWYFAYSNRIAIKGIEEDYVNFQISCGPALGAFNHWVAGTNLEPWYNRHVDDIAKLLMHEAAEVLNHRLNRLLT